MELASGDEPVEFMDTCPDIVNDARNRIKSIRLFM
jgi:hypothetical protein